MIKYVKIPAHFVLLAEWSEFFSKKSQLFSKKVLTNDSLWCIILQVS